MEGTVINLQILVVRPSSRPKRSEVERSQTQKTEISERFFYTRICSGLTISMESIINFQTLVGGWLFLEGTDYKSTDTHGRDCRSWEDRFFIMSHGFDFANKKSFSFY